MMEYSIFRFLSAVSILCMIAYLLYAVGDPQMSPEQFCYIPVVFFFLGGAFLGLHFTVRR